MEWYLRLDDVFSSRSENHNHTRRRTEESGNDPCQYSLTTLSIGRKNAPVSLSAFGGLFYLEFGRKLATRSDLDVHSLVVFISLCWSHRLWGDYSIVYSRYMGFTG